MIQYTEKPFGYNVYGFLSASFGLAVAAHNTVHLLHKLNQPLCLYDIDAGFGRSKVDSSCLHLGIKPEEPHPFQVNIFHMNPNESLQIMRQIPLNYLSSRLNICIPFWELPALPNSWIDTLNAMDLILAPTQFILQAIKNALPGAPCIHYPQAVILPENIKADRSRFGLSEHDTVFTTSFDVLSDLNRKNPWATIEAFKLAFPEANNQTLVLKVNTNKISRKTHHQELNNLITFANHPKIFILNEHLSYQDTLSLYNSSDVIVSLHRSEGLGLSLMEAMSLGKPVIATNWSGNTDFTNSNNSCLVDFKLVPTDGTRQEYKKEMLVAKSHWAEPNINSAKKYMRLLHENRNVRNKIGDQALCDMTTRREDYCKGSVWGKIKEQVLDKNSLLWQRKEENNSLIKKLIQ
jgi:glycosyltransferase involved in cell wall biosynthesis